MKAITEHTHKINIGFAYGAVFLATHLVIDYVFAWIIIAPGLCGYENPGLDQILPVWLVLIGLNILWYVIPLVLARKKGKNLRAEILNYWFGYLVVSVVWLATWALIVSTDITTMLGLYDPRLYSYDNNIAALFAWPDSNLNLRHASFLLWSWIATAELLIVFVVQILATNTDSTFFARG